MKPRFLALLLTLSAFMAVLLPRPVHAQDEVNFDFFYDSLKPYGEWIQVADYGLCWHPSGVAEDWAPYTDGYWAYTDGGWTWVSYEDFGSVVYHYGRWTNTEDAGWCWVPDYDWAPAWVSWRNNDDYVGWAPLPPEAHYRQDTGISVWADNTYDIGPGSYHFCHTRDFGAPVIREVILPPRENLVIVRNTVNITNISVSSGGFPFIGGPRYDYISTRVERPIPALRLQRETNIVNINNNNTTVINNFRGGVQQGNTIRFPAPRVRAESPAAVLARIPVKPTRVIPAAQVNHGWRAASAEDRQSIKAKFQAETKGATPETKKATPVTAAETKVLPKTADRNAKSPVAVAPKRTPVAPAAAATEPAPANQPPKVANRPAAPAVEPANPGNPNSPVTTTPAGKPVAGAKPGKPGKPAKPGTEGGFKPPVKTQPSPDNGTAADRPAVPTAPTNPGAAQERPPVRTENPAAQPGAKKGKPGKMPAATPGAVANEPTPTRPDASEARAARDAQVREQAVAAHQREAAAQQATRERQAQAAEAQREKARESQPQPAPRNVQAGQAEARERAARAQAQEARPNPVQRPQVPQPPRPQAQPARPQAPLPAAARPGAKPGAPAQSDDDDKKKKQQ